MSHRLSGSKSRLAASLMALSVVASGCASMPNSSETPSSSPTEVPGSLGNVPFIELAARAADAQPGYVVLLRMLRDAAGLTAALGPSGPSIYDFIDASEATALRDRATALFPGIGSTGQVASAAGGSEPGVVRPQEAVPTVFAAWLVTSMMAMFPERDTPGSHGSGGALPTGKDTFTSTEGGVTTSTIVTTDIGSVSWDGNNKAATVTIGHTTTITDATGKEIGHLTGTVTSTVEFQGCPASDGLVIGRIKFAIQEGSADAVVGGAFTKTTWEQNVHQHVGEDAWLDREESALTTDVAVRAGTKAAGQAPDVTDDWSASIGYTVDRVATGAPTSSSGLPDWQSDPAKPGQTAWTTDFRTVADEAAATKTVVDAAAGGAFVTGLPLLFVTESAQKYWRSGNCVEIAVLQGNGGDVDPGQHVQVVVQPRHIIDHVDLAKPVVATFSGVVGAEPLGEAVPAPATFTFTAGENEADQGTLMFKSTSNRGIGSSSIVFFVRRPETPSPSDGSAATERPFETLPPDLPSLRPVGVLLEGTLTATVTSTAKEAWGSSFLGTATLKVVVAAPRGLGLETSKGQQSGTFAFGGSWSGDCVGSGSAEGMLSDFFTDGDNVVQTNGTSGQPTADGRYLLGRMSVSDTPPNDPNHRPDLYVSGYAEIGVDGTCGHRTGNVDVADLRIHVGTCKGGVILKAKSPGTYAGSCTSDEWFGTTTWIGEIHQVSP